jgi:methylmalonyl-CoA mutase C-terminal domain/subunit
MENIVQPPEKIAHIGIAVKNIENVLPFYENLGVRLEKMEEVESEGVKIAFLKIGETRFELLEPLHKNSPIQSYLDKKGEGIHHIALEVDNINDRLKDLQSKGMKLINETPKQGAHNSQIAFIHPKEANGVLFELCESDKGGKS